MELIQLSLQSHSESRSFFLSQRLEIATLLLESYLTEVDSGYKVIKWFNLMLTDPAGVCIYKQIFCSGFILSIQDIKCAAQSLIHNGFIAFATSLTDITKEDIDNIYIDLIFKSGGSVRSARKYVDEREWNSDQDSYNRECAERPDFSGILSVFEHRPKNAGPRAMLCLAGDHKPVVIGAVCVCVALLSMLVVKRIRRRSK